MMEAKNPFSLFDFLGYFFPGAFALLIIWSSYIVWQKEDILAYLHSSVDEVIQRCSIAYT